MKIVVFGTGQYYKNRKAEVWKQEVVAFLDNNPDKQGKKMDNRMIYSPAGILDLKFDYILLMAKKEFCYEMRWQLLQLGIAGNMILEFEEFCEYAPQKEMQIYYTTESGSIFGDADKRIVLLSDGLSAADAPTALLYAAIIMKKNAYHPVIVSPKDGPLRSLVMEKNIPVVIERQINKQNLCIWEWLTASAFVWVNTGHFSYLIEDLEESGVKAVWWLHDADTFGITKTGKSRMTIPVYGLGKNVVTSINRFFMGG